MVRVEDQHDHPYGGDPDLLQEADGGAVDVGRGLARQGRMHCDPQQARQNERHEHKKQQVDDGAEKGIGLEEGQQVQFARLQIMHRPENISQWGAHLGPEAVAAPTSAVYVGWHPNQEGPRT
jgi:hypothetical protein